MKFNKRTIAVVSCMLFVITAIGIINNVIFQKRFCLNMTRKVATIDVLSYYSSQRWQNSNSSIKYKVITNRETISKNNSRIEMTQEIVTTNKTFATIDETPPCRIRDSGTWPSCNKLSSREPVLQYRQVGIELRSFESLAKVHAKDLLPGGLFRPESCRSSQRVAIIVPYRDRPHHLKTLLNYLHPLLKTQKIEYMIFVIEQSQGSVFNRGMIKNIGYVEARRLCDFDCYIFHDVDLIPLDSRNVYNCSEMPRHHAAAIDRFNYALPYKNIFGGVVSFRRDQFKRVNGYSNLYAGWGAEDDDLAKRVRFRGMRIQRYPMEISRYKDLKHKNDGKDPKRWIMLQASLQRQRSDGLNNLVYKVNHIEFRELFTWIHVNFDEQYYSGLRRQFMNRIHVW